MVSNFSSTLARAACLFFAVGAFAHGGDKPNGEPKPDEKLGPHEKLIEAGREQFTHVRKLETYSHTTTGRLYSKDTTQNEDRAFNGRSCAECHRLGGVGGAGPESDNVLLIGGQVLHRFGTAPDYAKKRLEVLKILAPNHPDVVAIKAVEAKPVEVKSVDAKSASNHRDDGLIACGFSSRRMPPVLAQLNTPALFGLGSLDAIPQATLDAIAAKQPEAIRGRSPRVADGRLGGFGRFGWKAEQATLAEFNEKACAAELGMKTARFSPKSELTPQKQPTDAKVLQPPPTLAGYMSADDVRALTTFVSSLPQPVQFVDAARKADVAEGARMFEMVGCTTCHVRDVGDVKGVYSDLLLHRVGSSGESFYGGPRSEMIVGGEPTTPAQPDEFRTPPLWGVGDSAPYWHDGSAATLAEAIERHAVQATTSVNKYKNWLSNEEQKQLVAFLRSLRAPGAAAPLDPGAAPKAVATKN